ncbi:MAG TPA: shikimate dehydrogenase [Anaerolineae bacterium]|nr:shikimate dehydrogenase [Anaerolineae bacterium]
MVTQYVAVYGDPVEGNPTSIMQNAAFEHAGLDWRYLDITVPAEDLEDAIKAARVLGFGGLNLTLPHKVAVIPLLDGLEPSAQISGACNTVVRQPDGRFIGSNTDGSGFVWSLRDEGIDPRGLDVVLLGAGGAARAVAVELALAGASRVSIAGRTAPRRDELVAILRDRTDVEAVALAWEATLAVPACDVLVDCTPVGMGSGAAAEAHVDVDLGSLPSAAVVCDLNPERSDTAFLRLARARGHRTIDGLGMLARQGAAGFKAWTGQDAPLEVMIEALGG